MGLNFKAITKIICVVMIFLGAAMLVPMAVSLIYEEISPAMVFGFTSLILMIVGGLIFYLFRSKNSPIRTRDGILSVSLVWIAVILMGAIPICIIGNISYIDALFESASGFTTTGASVIPEVDVLPKGLLFWRSFTNWLGGLGIIILVIAVFPMLDGSGHVLIKAEANRSRSDKISAKYSDTAKRLFFYYIIMTVLSTVALTLGPTSLFDSIGLSMSAVSTGGFTDYNVSLVFHDSSYTLWILTLFMTLGSINFALYYYLFSIHWREFFKDTELRWYILIIISGSMFITLDLFLTGHASGFFEALTHGTFNFVSILSTTGFSSDNYDLWPTFAMMILFLAMFIGGCSASTAGGIKTYRVVVAYKLIKRNLSRRLHPNAVVSIKNDEGPIRSDFISAIAAYIFLYMLVIFTGTILLSFGNNDFLTTLSAVVACTGNVGPGFGEVGAIGNYSFYDWWEKLLLSFLMLAGRLELFGIVLLGTRRFWNPDRYKA